VGRFQLLVLLLLSALALAILFAFPHEKGAQQIAAGLGLLAACNLVKPRVR